MATRTWSSSGSTDMNLGSNYSGSGALLATDDLFFNNTSIVNATATADLNVQSVTIAATYSGAWSIAGFNLTCALGFSDDGITGTHNYGNSITCNGNSSTFHVGSGVATITATSCALSLNGTVGMVLDDDKGITLKTLTLGAGAIVTNSGTASVTTFSSTTTPLTFVNGGTLTINAPITLYITGNVDAISMTGSVTITSTNASIISISFGAATVGLPALTLGGTLRCSLYKGGGGTSILNMNGNFSCNAATNMYSSSGGTGCTFNTNDYSISCTVFNYGSFGGSSPLTYNFGASSVTCTSAIQYNTSAAFVNLQTSSWSLSGNWTSYPINVLDPGTSTVTFTNTTTITSAGDPFYTVVFNGSGKIFTLADPMFTNTYTLTAGTIALSGFYIFQAGAATTNIWSAAADGNWNSAGNWSLGHAPTSGEDVLFSSSSIKNCTFDISPSVANIGFRGDYSGNLVMTGQSIALSGGMYDYGSGTRDYGTGITINGNSSGLFFGSTLGIVYALQAPINFNGTSGVVLVDNKGTIFKSLNLAANVSLVRSGSVAATYSAATLPLTMGNSSSLTINTANVVFICSGAASTFASFGTSCVVNGGANIVWSAGASVTVTMPAYTYTGTGSNNFYPSSSYTATVQLGGNIDCGVRNIFIYHVSSSLYTFNTANFNITCGQLNVGAVSAGSSLVANFGSSLISCTYLNATLYTQPTTLNFQTSQWTVTNSFTLGSNFTVDPGTSLITFTGTGASVVTLASKSLYDVVVNNASKAFSFADSPTLHNFTTTAMASVTHVGFTLTSSGNVTFNGSGTVNLGLGLTMNGASGTLTLSSTLGTVSAASCNLIFNGTTGMTYTNNKAITTFKSLTLGNSAVLALSGSFGNVFSGTTTVLTLGTSSTLTLNSQVQLQAGADMTVASLGAGYTLNGAGALGIGTSASCTATIPAITFTGALTVRNYANFLTSVFNLSGDLVITGNFSVLLGLPTSVTFNTNNFNITCSRLALGNDQNTPNVLTCNLGSSTIVCSSFDPFGAGLIGTGAANLNFQTSQWTVAGIWKTVSGSTIIDPGTSLVTFASAIVHTITSNGNSFYDIICNNSGNSSTFADNVSCHNFTIATTNNQIWNWTGFTLTASGNVSLNGTSNHNLGNGITLTGASSTLFINSTVGTMTSASCVLIFNGTTGCSLTDNKGLIFKKLTLGASAVLTINGTYSNGIGFSDSASSILTLGNGAALTVNQRLNLYAVSATNINFWSIGTSCTINGTAVWNASCEYANSTANIPPITYTGSGKLTISSVGGFSIAGPITFTLTGDVNWGTAAVDLSGGANAAVTRTYNFQSYGITCGALAIGNSGALATDIFNMGSGTFSVASLTGSTFNSGSCSINLQTSQWTCSGNWIYGSTHAIDIGTTSQITFSNAGSHSITSNGKNFPTCIAQADTVWH